MIDSHLLNGGGVGAEREGGIRCVELNGGLSLRCVCCDSPHSHGVTGPPKPDPVKRWPPTVRRFYLTELAVSVDVCLSFAPGPRQRC